MAEAPTQSLAQYVAAARDLPHAVEDHASRTFVNFLGCALLALA